MGPVVVIAWASVLANGVDHWRSAFASFGVEDEEDEDEDEDEDARRA